MYADQDHCTLEVSRSIACNKRKEKKRHTLAITAFVSNALLTNTRIVLSSKSVVEVDPALPIFDFDDYSHPQFASAIACTTETVHSDTVFINIVVCCLASLAFFRIHVIECELGSGRNVLQRKEGQIVDSSIESVVTHSEQTAIWITAVIDKPSWAAHLFAVCYEAVALVQRARMVLISGKLVEPEHVRSLVKVAGFFTSIGLGIGDEFAKVSIDVLTSFKINRTAKAWLDQSWVVVCNYINMDLPKPRPRVLNISRGTFRPFCTSLFLQPEPHLQSSLHS